jgi:nicotinate phosphoribosyltransferase
MCAWANEASRALLVDLYELSMAQCYYAEGLTGLATFELIIRSFPPGWTYLLAAGLDDALDYLERLAFSEDDLDYLTGLGIFSARFLERLRAFRFTGDVAAVPEGTPVFAGEPLLAVTAPLPEAQIVETFLLNQVAFQTLVASHARRIVEAAGGRAVVDFSLRRAQGADAGLKAARAFFLVGGDATSNVLAAKAYGIPLAGTMAHSFVEAHAGELEAFRSFIGEFPDATLLVDTYDTLAGLRRAAELCRELGPKARVRGVRLDSGDLGELAAMGRRILDDAGLSELKIYASGGLDVDRIDRLVHHGAPVDGFGVGAELAAPAACPCLDAAYKLVAMDGRDCMKLSPGKATTPGAKQVWRLTAGGEAVFDTIGRADEKLPGRKLLEAVMRRGQRTEAGSRSLSATRRLTGQAIDELPRRLRQVKGVGPAFRVLASPRLEAAASAVAAALSARGRSQ